MYSYARFSGCGLAANRDHLTTHVHAQFDSIPSAIVSHTHKRIHTRKTQAKCYRNLSLNIKMLCYAAYCVHVHVQFAHCKYLNLPSINCGGGSSSSSLVAQPPHSERSTTTQTIPKRNAIVFSRAQCTDAAAAAVACTMRTRA